MGLDGLTQLMVVLGSIGVGEACQCFKVSCLNGLKPCGIYWETGGCMEVADKCLNSSEVRCALCREQDTLCF